LLTSCLLKLVYLGAFLFSIFKEFQCENVFHFFLECPINEHIRNTLFLILQIYGAIIDIDIILYGSENLTEAQNVDIFTAELVAF
jgi:hypothetical protein